MYLKLKNSLLHWGQKGPKEAGMTEVSRGTEYSLLHEIIDIVSNTWYALLLKLLLSGFLCQC